MESIPRCIAECPDPRLRETLKRRYLEAAPDLEKQNVIALEALEYSNREVEASKRARLDVQRLSWRIFFLKHVFVDCPIPDAWLTNLVDLYQDYDESLVICTTGEFARSRHTIRFWGLVQEYRGFVSDVQQQVLALTPVRFHHIELLPRYTPGVSNGETPPAVLMYGALTLRQITTLLDGLDWHACDDIHFRKRSPQWLREVLNVSVLCAMRCFQIAANHTDLQTLDASDYSKETIFVKSKELKVRQAHVVYEFLFAVETWLSSIWKQAYDLLVTHAPLFDIHRHPPECQPAGPALVSLVGFIARRAAQLRDEEVVETRKRHSHSLQITWSDYRWAKLFSSDLNSSSSSTEYVKRCNRGRPQRDECPTKAHILSGKIHLKEDAKKFNENFEVHEIVSVDSLLILHSITAPGGDLIQFLLENKVFVFQPILQGWIFRPSPHQRPIWSSRLVALFVTVRLQYPQALARQCRNYTALDRELGITG
jgi:hypothetical protein